MINKTVLLNSFWEFDRDKDNYMGVLFTNIFQSFPESYKIFFDKNDNLKYLSYTEEFDTIKDVKSKIDDRFFLKTAVSFKNNDTLYVLSYTAHEWIILYGGEDYNFLVCVLMTDDTSSDYFLTVYTDNIEKTFDHLKYWIIKSDYKKKIEFGITAVDTTGSLYTSWYDYTAPNIDIDMNYNDDIPYYQMCELLDSKDKPELLLFYGEPGTGKTSLIKHFIAKYPSKEFVFMDGTLMANVQQEKLISYFLENQNTIFILEDCEKILLDRDKNINPVMPVLLNLTDGIIGDVLGIKLICTFNTNLKNIDKALLRKGRLSLKYEFKKLNKDKVNKILGDLKKDNQDDMTLADLYYYKQENDYSKDGNPKQTKKIGFY